MKNALILHGAGNNSSGNWFPWLKLELEKKGYKVWSPDLPNSDIPVESQWLNVIFKNKQWVFDRDSVLIGHSSGATLILRILEKLPEGAKIKKAILVAGPIDKGTIKKFWPYKEDLTKDPFSWQKIKSACQEFILIYSDNDPYDCGIRHGKVIAERVNGSLILKTGQGHFNLEVGLKYRQFPWLLEYI